MNKHVKKRHKRISPAKVGVSATPERCRQNGGIKVEVIDRDYHGKALIQRHSAVSDCVLDTYYYIRRSLDRSAYEAGMRFRKAYLRAVLNIKVEDSGGGAHDPEMAFLIVPISEQILKGAYKVLSPAQKRVIVDVCGHDAWAGTTAKIKTLQRGLDVLARHWKLI